MRDREYRAVLLTVDEAVELNKAAGNRVTRPCCPHLDVFHSSGKTTHGKSWRFCNIQGCSCHEETGHALSYCHNCMYDKREERQWNRERLIKTAIWAAVAGGALAIAVERMVS